MKHPRFLLSMLLALTATTLSIVVASAGNDFIVGNLRVDLPEVYNSGRYRVLLYAGDKPTTGNQNDFSTGWIGVFLHELQYDAYGNPIPFSAQFSQVGIQTFQDGAHWFVYAEPGVTCIQGQQVDPLMCRGALGDIVNLGEWHWVKLVKFSWNDFWIAYVCRTDNTCVYVAEINSNSNCIYWAHADAEEGYVETTDPYIGMNFYFWHPQYWTTDWQEWPMNGGGTQISYLQAIPAAICPAHYGAIPAMFNDARAWWAGSFGPVCYARLFEFDVFLPLIMKNSP